MTANSKKLVTGLGVSHDAGICIVAPQSGKPLFACSLERFSRRKGDEGSPIELFGWAEQELGRRLVPWRILALEDDAIFLQERGFHALERNGTLKYRWTAAEARFVPSAQNCTTITLVLLSAAICGFERTASVWINGKEHGSISNVQPEWTFSIEEPIREIRIISKPYRSGPDPRDLGIAIMGIAMWEAPSPFSTRFSHSEASLRKNLARTLYTQFLYLRYKGLRGHPRPALRSLLSFQIKSLFARTLTYSEHLIGKSLCPAEGRYDHHACHAASAYYPSGMKTALVLSVDGIGDRYSAQVYLGDKGRLHLQKSYFYEELPIGLEYEIITTMLGFRPARHEGKITGLAAFGKENPECDKALCDFFDDLWKRGRQPLACYDDFMRTGIKGWEQLRALRPTRLGAFSREDLAFAIQKRFERQLLDLITEWKDKLCRPDCIALSGGVFANVKLNQHIKELGFKRIFIQPAMSDSGLCFGAALLRVAEDNGGRLEPFTLRDVFLGPGYSNDEIKSAIDQFGVKARYYEENELPRIVAQFIAEKKVVAHFHGRMEYGPRALGNRSILYSAKDPAVNQWLNKQLNRTEFMPFAPAIMYEHAAEYFENVQGAEHPAEFMTITFAATKKAQNDIPAAIHVDNTARPQLVHAERNPRFYSILKAYYEITGVPVTINTSFNMHEEPIVASPHDAIRSFQQGNLDVLVLGNWIVLAGQ